MPEYVAKAWYKDAGMWMWLLTTVVGILSAPEMGDVIPQPYLSKLVFLLGAVGAAIRGRSTARPVGWSDGSRAVQVHHIERKPSGVDDPYGQPPRPRPDRR